MPRISLAIDIHANKDRVWEVVSDLEHEYNYWYGTKQVRTVSTKGNEIDREIIQAFRDHVTVQKAILSPKDSIEIRYLKGLTEGVKTMSIETLNEEDQRLNVFWDIHYTGVYRLLTPLIKSHTVSGTTHALKRIKEACEAGNIGTTEDQKCRVSNNNISIHRKNNMDSISPSEESFGFYLPQ